MITNNFSIRQWVSRFFNPVRPRRRASLRAKPPARYRPWVEALEDRLVPALDITAQDIIIDETAGLQKDDVNSSPPPNLTVQYLLGLDGSGGLPSPEVAF